MAVAPFREDLVVAVECMFTWYWLADLCRSEGIEFVLGHALYMKAIHGGKAKNDRLDAYKIATPLRGGTLPNVYVYSPEMRATRDLLRKRLYLVRRRVNLLSDIQNTRHQYNLPVPPAKIAYYDDVIRDLQLHLERRVKEQDAQAYYRLPSEHSWGAEGRSSNELCPLLEPGASWL